MLRYKTETRPGLVALYDIRPGNGAGPFLQPRSLHAYTWNISKVLRYLSSDITVLPAHPAFHRQLEWAIPAFVFPATAGTHSPMP